MLFVVFNDLITFCQLQMDRLAFVLVSPDWRRAHFKLFDIFLISSTLEALGMQAIHSESPGKQLSRLTYPDTIMCSAYAEHTMNLHKHWPQRAKVENF